MIPYDVITAHGVSHPWPTREQIEQDLLLDQAICEIYQDELLKEELVFRGGTALHKLFFPEPFRYSEDLDFVRTTGGGIGSIIDRIVSIGTRLGYSAKTQMGKYPKIFWKGTTQTGLGLKIKIEINTYERYPALPLLNKEYTVSSDWYTNTIPIKTFQAEELAATKIRALYQRAKGRDLFDLWLLLTMLNINEDKIYSAFETYRPEKFSSKNAIENLLKKLSDKNFLIDMNNLATGTISDYRINDAASLVTERILSKL